MRTCSKCNATSPDNALKCVNCNIDLNEFSATAVSLMRLRASPRVTAVRVSVGGDACPHCYELLKTYPKDEVPRLPHEGCSHDTGCRCFYEPVLSETAIVGKVVQ